jgi:hypothetical protein
MDDEINVLRDPEEELIELINKDNITPKGSINLTLDDVELSDPVSVSYGGRNTRVTVKAKPSSKYTGTKDVFYNRLALSDLGYIGIISDEPISAQMILEMITSKKGISMLADDFEPIIIPYLEAGEALKINLIAKPTAIKWYGQTQADYAFGIPAGLGLLHELIHNTLPTQGYLTQ